jgi:hypothetical protein
MQEFATSIFRAAGAYVKFAMKLSHTVQENASALKELSLTAVTLLTPCR